MHANLKHLKDVRAVVPIISHFNLSVWNLQKPDKLSEMTVDYCKFN